MLSESDLYTFEIQNSYINLVETGYVLYAKTFIYCFTCKYILFKSVYSIVMIYIPQTKPTDKYQKATKPTIYSNKGEVSTSRLIWFIVFNATFSNISAI